MLVSSVRAQPPHRSEYAIKHNPSHLQSSLGLVESITEPRPPLLPRPSILRHTEVPRRYARHASLPRRPPPGKLPPRPDGKPGFQEHFPHWVPEHPSEPGADHVQQRLSALASGADST